MIFIFLISLVFIGNVNAAPQIEFVNPTPNESTEIINTDIEINVSIIESDLGEMKFNWNNINYTFYDNSLVLMMNFDNVSALGENNTHVVDISKYGNNGTVINATWNSTGKYGGAFKFDGDGDYVSTSEINISRNQSFTVIAWAKKHSNDDSVHQIFDLGGYGISIKKYQSSDQRKYMASVKDASGTGNHNAFYTDLDYTDSWVHFALVYDDSDKQMRVYTNAGNLNTYDVNGFYGYDTTFEIGGAYAGYFNGTIDEIAIYNRSLSTNEIKRHYYSNLYKYDTNKWVFYTNIKKPDLNFGSNTYFAATSNSSGSENLTETRTITVLFKTTDYYDGRKAVVVLTGDDWGSTHHQFFMDASDVSQRKKVVFSPGIMPGLLNESCWSGIQSQVNEGFVSPASHSFSHPHPPYDNTTLEVCDSRLHIIGNLTLPWQNWFNGSEYLVGWLEPYGESDSIIMGNLSKCNYLCSRSTSTDISSWSSWNNSYGLYDRCGVTVAGDNPNLTTLNNNFNDTYNNGGIYNFYFHPQNHNWTDTDKIPQHLSHIGNRTDVWYVGWGQLYMYRYLEDKIKPTVNITTRNNQQIITKINVSGAERNKYGLSYPITYAFAIPTIWSNVFVFYKNTSNDNYTLMTEKTRNEYWIGIDAYRTNLSESGVYVSKSFPQTSNEFYLKIVPILSTNFGGDTTDLTATNLSNITNLILEKTSYGKINFSESVNLSGGADINTHVSISNNRIEINSTALPVLNKSATLYLYNLNLANPQILKDGEICPSSICTEVSYSGGNFTFTVTQFSVYTTRETPTTETPEETPSGGGSTTPTYKPTQEQLEENYTKTLYKNWQIEFEFNNETHTIKLDDIINKTAIITVSSIPQTFNLTVNQTKKLNLNDDNYSDLQIFLKNITDIKADLIVTFIHEEIPAEFAGEEEKEVMEKGFQIWLIIIGVISVIVIVAVIVLIMISKYRFRKKLSKKSTTEERLGISGKSKR